MVSLDFATGRVFVGRAAAPMRLIDREGSIQVDFPEGPTIRPLTLREREQSIANARNADHDWARHSPAQALAHEILARATQQGTNALTGSQLFFYQAVALHLAGATVTAPPSHQAVCWISANLGWHPDSIWNCQAAEIDRLVANCLPARQSDWNQLVMLDAQEDPVAALAEKLATDLLRRAQTPDADFATAAHFSPNPGWQTSSTPGTVERQTNTVTQGSQDHHHMPGSHQTRQGEPQQTSVESQQSISQPPFHHTGDLPSDPLSARAKGAPECAATHPDRAHETQSVAAPTTSISGHFVTEGFNIAKQHVERQSPLLATGFNHDTSSHRSNARPAAMPSGERAPAPDGHRHLDLHHQAETRRNVDPAPIPEADHSAGRTGNADTVVPLTGDPWGTPSFGSQAMLDSHSTSKASHGRSPRSNIDWSSQRQSASAETISQEGLARFFGTAEASLSDELAELLNREADLRGID